MTTALASAAFVFAAALATALATGLVAAPFVLVPRLARSWVGITNAVAAGCMLAASGLLFYEGGRENAAHTAVGALVGALFVGAAARQLAARREIHFAALAGVDARKALLLVGVMTVHSFAEGVGVGVAFGGGESLGLVTALAIALHNIPEGLAISLVLIPRGVRVLRAAGWSIFSSLPQPLVALPVFAFVATFAGLLPAGLGFAGGAMVWMVAASSPTRCGRARVRRSRCRGRPQPRRSPALKHCFWPLDAPGDAENPQRSLRLCRAEVAGRPGRTTRLAVLPSSQTTNRRSNDDGNPPRLHVPPSGRD